MVPDPQQELPERLRALRALCQRASPPGSGSESDVARAASSAADRLDRDLLPRTAGGSAHLVVGIVGPNNAGKSALFNSLVGRVVSPSRPTGGATRRLVGAAHPALFERLEREPTLARFALRRVTPGPEGVELALDDAEDPTELLLVEVEGLEDGVLLVDTPDFDSIKTHNRGVSEALLRVADLALVVVTRHTYQNREVVEFLEAWLAHGRPWLLVYNESIAADVTVAHAAKLGEDLGAPPVATFHAAFDFAVAEGKQPLAPRALAAAAGDREVTDGAPLRSWLFDLSEAADLKGAALEASLAQLRDELAELSSALDVERAHAAELIERARGPARRLGGDVASEAMPMGPFLEGFRAVLDKRPSLVQKGIRGALRHTRIAIGTLVSKLPGRGSRKGAAGGAAGGANGTDAPSRLVEVERAALERAWPPFFEALSLDFAPGRATTRDGESLASALDPGLAERIAADLVPDNSRHACRRAVATLADDPEVLREFQGACEELIEEELATRGSEWFFQLAVDLVHLLPAVAAGVVIVNTGGLGADVAVGSAGALTSLLAERLSRLLGTAVAWRARERWTELRGSRLADVVLESALETSWPRLVREVEQRGALSAELSEARRGIDWESIAEVRA